MQKLILELDWSGPAFEANPSLELARILRGLGYMLQEAPVDLEHLNMPLMDKYENQVGFVRTLNAFEAMHFEKKSGQQ
jgi:hypothetical protein